MGILRVLKVEYSGDKYFFASPSLDNRLSLIAGPNGTGKSTFFNFIYFGLGGKVAEFDDKSPEVHKQVMTDTNNLVRLAVRINSKTYTLTRKIRENLITVFEEKPRIPEAELELSASTMPIYRNGEARTFSDWLLEELGIPVVDISQGGRSFKLNFTDLSRLIYYNQIPDPSGIYKPAESVNFISDSLEIRRAIFQILVGRTLLELYSAIGRMKLADREFQSAKAIHQEYQEIVAELLKASGIETVQNTKSLSQEVDRLELQVEFLLELRRGFVRRITDGETARGLLDQRIRQVQELASERRVVDLKLAELEDETARMVDLERLLKDDVARLNKVIYTHDQLGLFSSDTCPYCLNNVTRQHYKCVCGHDVNEDEYQRFFYSSAEYLDILRSKLKALETLGLAAISLKDERKLALIRRSELNDRINSGRRGLDEFSGETSLVDEAMEEADNKILDVRSRLGKVQEAFRLESKLSQLQTRLTSKRDQYASAKIDVDKLDAASKSELRSQLIAFNFHYNEMMTAVVADCRIAEIDAESYLPILNNGEYREASANVPKRFLYFLTLLQLSLLDEIPFPKLLLIDTPETAGIDLENLVKMLRLADNLKNPKGKEHQIILSTGVGKYPPEFEPYVVLNLSKSDKLLQTRKNDKS